MTDREQSDQVNTIADDMEELNRRLGDVGDEIGKTLTQPESVAYFVVVGSVGLGIIVAKQLGVLDGWEFAGAIIIQAVLGIMAMRMVRIGTNRRTNP